MKIADVEIYRFRIPFAAPVRIGQGFLDMREGFILALTDDSGMVGYGEVAPLQGWDKTTIDQCRQDLLSLRDRLTGAELSYSRFQAAAPLLGITSVTIDNPSLLTTHTWFGLECALLGLFVKHNADDHSAAASKFTYPLCIPVNGLFLPGEDKEIVSRQIRELKESAVKTVKVKIGRMTADEEIRQIISLAAELSPPITFRLDGNRSLTPEVYRNYYEHLRHLNVEYIEEPLFGGDIVSAGNVPWPVAMDESLEGLLDVDEPQLSSLHPLVRAIILKPGLFNGLHALARCMADADRGGIKTVLSSAFNTGVTLAALGILHRLTGVPQATTHGLDTLRYLTCDVLTEPPVIHEGSLVIPESFAYSRQRLNETVIRREAGL